jgi:hypothetical protein
MLNYSCTPLPMWIRSMEYLFNIACRLPNVNRTSATRKEFEGNKKALQARFWARLNLGISEVKHYKGSSNNGNTGRKIFNKNPELTAFILGMGGKIITLLDELLDMFNGPLSMPCRKVFQPKVEKLFGRLTSPLEIPNDS